MADITLAECNGRVWFVSDETFLDDLLGNTLPPGISCELVSCESMAAVHELWVQHCGQPAQPGDPWMIHPAIVDRIRRRSPDHAVFFAQWSAFLDDEARVVIAAAANWAHQNESTPVVLVEFTDPDGPRSMADLSSLRAQVVEDELVTRHVPRERISRVRRNVAEVPGMAQESQRIDVVVRAA